ncbi:neuropeptide CCHamide-1 receptor-like [Physella acuta]|uniref:neuropeptide CCHamide-1 receptor-like n=1 Tax=Physella acuta TaxID=109671 RepID=UPI0027DC3C37|nr:neuropeptide CCHamide-1 receptor-like [Physella acuta]
MDNVFTAGDGSEKMTTYNITGAALTNSSDRGMNFTDLYDSKPEAIIVPFVFAVILIVGVTGNLLLILSFARHKTLSTPHNALVVNLASGDFIFLIVSLPFNSMWYTLPYWPFGLTLCKVSHFAENLATGVVITTLSVLSIERCLIVTGKKLWRQKKKVPILMTISLWVVSAVIALPNLLSSNIVYHSINKQNPICDLYDANWGELYKKLHVIFRFVLLFCLPLLVIAVAYTIIAAHLLLSAFPLSKRTATASKPKNSSELKQLVSKNTDAVDAADANSSKKQGKDSNDAGNSKHAASSKPASQSHDEKSGNSGTGTEISENKQTTSHPNSFVYTGPIPENDTPYQKKDNAHPPESKTETIKKPPTESTSVQIAKETTPLNPTTQDLSAKPAPPASRQTTMLMKRRRLALTVLMLILAFAVCWTPRHIFFLWFHVIPGGNYNHFWHIFKIVGFCLSFSNSAVTPVVFYVLDSKYRSFVHHGLCCLCMRRCSRKDRPATETVITMGDRDYTATIAMTDLKSKDNVTQL